MRTLPLFLLLQKRLQKEILTSKIVTTSNSLLKWKKVHMEEKKCKSTYVKEVISALQNLILKQKKYLTVLSRAFYLRKVHISVLLPY